MLLTPYLLFTSCQSLLDFTKKSLKFKTCQEKMLRPCESVRVPARLERAILRFCEKAVLGVLQKGVRHADYTYHHHSLRGHVCDHGYGNTPKV